MKGPDDRHAQGAADSGTPAAPADTTGDALVERLVEESRGFVAGSPVPDFTAQVMSRIEQLDRPLNAGAARRPWSWLRNALLTPRRVSFQFRPVSLLAASVAMVAFLVSAVPLDRGASTIPDSGSIFVQFRLYAPDAASVRLAGSFTGWQPAHPLYQTSPGVWTVTVPLPPGVHDYSFVVDDRDWVTDPYAPGVDDGFGGTTSRMALLAPGDPRL